MISTITTASVSGIDAYKITAEVDMTNSIPAIIIVGLPDAAVSEAKERVRSAIKNSGFQIPNKKIVVNLAPADLKRKVRTLICLLQWELFRSLFLLILLKWKNLHS